MVKKVIQQGHSHFDARSVLPVREHGKRARTPLVDVSTAKGRERRWWLFSTFPLFSLKAQVDCNGEI
jgi:hypothetical protein